MYYLHVQADTHGIAFTYRTCTCDYRVRIGGLDFHTLSYLVCTSSVTSHDEAMWNVLYKFALRNLSATISGVICRQGNLSTRLNIRAVRLNTDRTLLRGEGGGV